MLYNVVNIFYVKKLPKGNLQSFLVLPVIKIGGLELKKEVVLKILKII